MVELSGTHTQKQKEISTNYGQTLDQIHELKMAEPWTRREKKIYNDPEFEKSGLRHHVIIHYSLVELSRRNT